MDIFLEEARAGDGGQADDAGHPFAEGVVIADAEFGDVHEDIVGALWVREGEAQVLHTATKEVFAVRILGLQAFVIVVAEIESDDGCFHEG